MRPIYHIASAVVWHEALVAGVLRAESLETEGFIHCSQAHQVADVVARFFADAEELLLICVDGDLLGATLVFEPPADGAHKTLESFPHIYGLIPVEAVVATARMQRAGDGRMHWPVQWELCTHKK